MCEPCNKSKPSSLSWHELLTQVYLWTNHLCISHLNILVHLGCHSITKTKLGTFQWGIFIHDRGHFVGQKCPCNYYTFGEYSLPPWASSPFGVLTGLR
jgi:hypothetical protein